MTLAGRAALLLAGMGSVACGAHGDSSPRDSFQRRLGDAGRAGAAGGDAVSEAGPRDATADVASDAAGAGDAGSTGAIVGMPLATFDTALEGFILNTTVSDVIFGNNGVQNNLAGFTTGLPRAELSHDATAGAPTPGCLSLSAPFSGGGGDFVEVAASVAGIQDWSGRILHVRARVASGTFTGVAQLLATSSSVTSAWSTTTLRSDGGWQDLTLDVSDAPRPSLGFDPAQIVAFGLQFHVGPNLGLATRGLIVFQIDSFSLESPPDPLDAGR